MCLPIHKNDFAAIPDEASFLEATRRQSLKPSSSMLPFADSMQQMGSPEHLAKLKEGPVGFVTILPNGPPQMGKCLAQWFAYSVVMSLLVGDVGTQGLESGASFLSVFRPTAAVALAGYGLSNAVDSIWKGVSWKVSAKFFFDGMVYAVAPGVAFGWLWPEA